MRTYASLLAGSAMIALAADNGAAAGAQAPAAPAPKYYKATAQARAADDAGVKAEVSFVVSGPDYKSAWETAREITRVGTADEDAPTAWTDAGRGTELKMSPGRFTVQDVASLQARSTKTPVISIENLIAALETKKVAVPASVQKVIDDLLANGPASSEPTAPAPAPAAEPQKAAAQG